MPQDDTNYREYVLRIAPKRPFGGRLGQRLIGVVALLFDLTARGMRDAVRAPWIGDDVGPAPDALGPAGRELSMPRYPNETAEQYEARLEDPWDTWALAGTTAAITAQLEAFGLSDIEIRTARDGWDWDSAAPGDWSAGTGGSGNWSRFWVIIKGHPWGASNDLVNGVGGLTATVEEIRTVRAIVQKWRSGRWLNPWIIVVLDETTWNAEQPNGTWHDWRNRSASARYVDGAGQLPVLLP